MRSDNESLYVIKMIEGAKLPVRKFPTDAGIDFYSLEDYIVSSHSWQVCRTGIKISMPENTVGLIYPKSRNDHLIGAGVVDSDYTGEILIKIINYTDDEMIIKAGTAIGQMVLLPCFTPEVVEKKEELDYKTARGATGGIVTQLSLSLEDLK